MYIPLSAKDSKNFTALMRYQSYITISKRGRLSYGHILKFKHLYRRKCDKISSGGFEGSFSKWYCTNCPSEVYNNLFSNRGFLIWTFEIWGSFNQLIRRFNKSLSPSKSIIWRLLLEIIINLHSTFWKDTKNFTVAMGYHGFVTITKRGGLSYSHFWKFEVFISQKMWQYSCGHFWKEFLKMVLH